MEVILLQRIEKLGMMGDIVTVKPGYARNFLLPKGMADRATQDRIDHFASMKQQFEADNVKKRDEAEKLAGKMKDTIVEFIRSAGDTGNLYGSIRRKDVASAVTTAGFTIAKDQVKLLEPVKTIGVHTVAIQLHPEVATSVIVNVAMTSEEAKAQLSGDKDDVSEKKTEAEAEADVAVEETTEA